MLLKLRGFQLWGQGKTLLVMRRLKNFLLSRNFCLVLLQI